MDRTTILSYRDSFSVHGHVRSRLVHEGADWEEPVVSIMIPTYKRQQLIAAAIGSALGQVTDVKFEVVVVDNDPDPSQAHLVDSIVAGFSARNLWLYRNDENLGMFGNWNRCLKLARGRWVTILNDDDLLDKDFLSNSLSLIFARPEIRMVGCQTRMLDERGESVQWSLLRRLGHQVKRWTALERQGDVVILNTEDYFLSNPHFGSLGILMQREAAVSLGGFSPDLYPTADFIFFVRFQLTYGAHFLRRVLASYRVHENESQKPAVALGWIQQGLQLRAELATVINCCPWLLNSYARLIAIDSARVFQLFWNRDIDVGVLLRQVDLPNSPVYVLKHLSRVALTAVFWLRQRLR